MNHQIHKNDHDQSKDFKLGADYAALILATSTVI